MSTVPPERVHDPTLADGPRGGGPSFESWVNDTMVDESDSFEALLAAAVCPPNDAPDAAVSAGGELPAGARVGDRFVVERFAGAGGMGAVYRCLDEQTHRSVALKVLRGHAGQYAGRFRREASVLGALTHPAIVRYVAHGCTDDGMPYLAMQWLDGEDLAARLLRGRLTLHQSVTLGRRMCQGMAAAHARGFLHRDLKPSNVFLVDGKVASAKLLDFGLAHRRAGTQTLTRAGTILGTVGYMAPEQAAGAVMRDPRGDLFSIGCVLYECLTGTPAFTGENYLAVLDNVMRTDVPRVSALREGIPRALDELLVSLLSKAPDGRPAEASIAARQLSALEWRTPWARRGHERRAPRVLEAPPSMEVVVAIEPHPESPASSLGAVVQTGLRAGLEPAGVDQGPCILSGGGGDTLHLIDRAERVLRWALQAQRDHPTLAFSVATGLMDRRSDGLFGEAVDRAVLRVPRSDIRSLGVVADELTLALLDPASPVVQTPLDLAGGAVVTELMKNDGGFCDRPSGDLPGRDKELLLLGATLSECIADAVARVVVVHGEPKIGKTCLARAFISKIVAEGQATWMVQCGEPTRRDDALGFVRRLLGASTPSQTSGSLQEDSSALREGLRTWLMDKTRCEPLVLVLEDMHWIDVASVRCIAASLEGWSERSLLVLGLTRPDGRPGVREAWREAVAQEVVVRGITDRVARRWVAAVLGQDASHECISRTVRLADGKPRLLQALARAEADPRALPELALALAQDELSKLAPGPLRAIRAASVLGACFCAEAVSAVLGDRLSSARRSLDSLVRRGLLVGPPPTQEVGYMFKNELVEQAARRLLRADELHVLRARADRWSTSGAAAGSTIYDP